MTQLFMSFRIPPPLLLGSALTFSLVLQSGCSTLTANHSENAQMLDPITQRQIPVIETMTEEEFGPAPEEESPHPSQFSKDVLYDLLIAELSGQRGELDTLVNNYVATAFKTRDIGVIKRAINAAQYAKDEETLTELTLLWAEEAPEDVDAHQLAAFQLIKKKDFENALFHMERVLDLEGPTTFDRLALHAKNLGDEEKAELLRLYSIILERHPDNGELLYGYAVLQELNGLYDEALDSTNRLLEQQKKNPAVISLRSRLLKEVEGIDTALAYLKEETRKLPDEMQLGTLYARTLIEAKDFEKAETIYKSLMERFSDAPHLKLSYGLVALENGKLEIAQEQLEQLISEGQHLNEAHFYLGRIADQEDQVDEAIGHYQQVNRGGHYFNALARSAYLLIQSGRPDEAAIRFSSARQNMSAQANQLWELEINLMVEIENFTRAMELADLALEEFPDDIQLRYARAMIRDNQGMLPEMENDLRHILQQDPENSVALNALGYTLADKTDRYLEAYDLISKALQIDPENPAILDSMGWVKFRLGSPEEALEYLQEAYSRFPDPEVAAHLGEVLWTLDRQEDAKVIWREAKEAQPDHPLLNATLERLNVEL
ncbi:tetratricopeptide repeat protein [Hahella ganghwensis]|uniref:tetratricopeptide repeat protein n=1 Tax=Hahella ganghwensis TaxID=286420 RepID=UPI0003A4C52F|nr:tetratricopeptide repeat protein [Hahella ganghwensis]